jgi:hypothetical protein
MKKANHLRSAIVCNPQKLGVFQGSWYNEARLKTCLRKEDAMYDDTNKNAGPKDLTDQFDLSSKPTVHVDVDRYKAYLDGSGMNDAQKEEFLQALWSIIVNFVELGYGVHPLQEVCGKEAGTASDGAIDARDAVSCKDTKQEQKPKRPKP